MAEILEIFSRNVRYYRGERTQKDVADAAGIGIEIVQRLEQGRTWPRLENVRKLAKALGVEESALFNDGKLPPALIVKETVSLPDAIREVRKFLWAIADEKEA